MENLISHIDSIEPKISRMPQFSNREQLISCLSQPNLEINDINSNICLSTNDKRYEIIIENQRGATIGGNHVYSKESVVYPIDPPKYQTLWGDTLVAIGLYPDPGLDWRWTWDKWHILMINDVDEEGWVYSGIRFGSKHWIGVGKMGKFVRRRIWIRLAQKLQKQVNADGEGLGETETLYIQEQSVKKPSKMDFFRRRRAAKVDNKQCTTDIAYKDNNNTITKIISSNNVSVNSVAFASDNVSKEKTNVDILNQLIKDLENAKIDRIRANLLLDFFFSSERDTLAYVLENLDYFKKLYFCFTFRNSRERFVQKFETNLQQMENSTKCELLYQVFKNFKSST